MNPTHTIATVPDTLLSYITQERQRGVDRMALQQALAGNNWQPEMISAAFDQTWPADKSEHPVWQTIYSDSFLAAVFRGGFAFIFLINGVVAWVRPADFIKLLSSFPLAVDLGRIPQMVMFTGLHDLTLGLLILSGRWRKYVWAWAGIWLSLVTIIKLVSLL